MEEGGEDGSWSNLTCTDMTALLYPALQYVDLAIMTCSSPNVKRRSATLKSPGGGGGDGEATFQVSDKAFGNRRRVAQSMYVASPSRSPRSPGGGSLYGAGRRSLSQNSFTHVTPC